MAFGDNSFQLWLARFEKHKFVFTFGLIGLYLFTNNSINATSVLMEHSRGGQLSISIWEPFAWEYTSALSTFLLLPAMFAVFRRFPPRFSHIPKQILIHLLAATLFSIAHVLLMVMFREIIYFFAGGNYDFAPWLREFWYEYRKDIWGYITWLVLHQLVIALYGRLKGEASLIKDEAQESQQDDSTSSNSAAPHHLLVKKLDKEFLVKVTEVEWLESAGNYVNLYQGGRIYPLRGTLGNTLQRIESMGFSRIHRSHGVNHAAIDNIQYAASGDGVVTLKSGKQLAISRRYKSDFKEALS
ncbi:LytTR family DNA-binding domain-containing protein [Aliiglaciecola sp. LCG003]|uniref:LytR/AlgR family response regulator transcription factor n=1 Tax=Aliiglaciecola sp. LCG003 TaxID=3053655 RepID=UPI00257318A8|nr:LytTR family DNA-binding domain-containing protein [Aliiglaciecola sp. LCG003]WJG08104.1 LytTR family DNA-binding domain-containing protein [Aliiglaciecola sp. LCG003]